MRTSFIQDDIDMLAGHFPLDLLIDSGVRTAVKIVSKAAAADICLCWFASVYSFFMVLGAKVGRRKSIIVLGGVDTAKEKSMNYGIWLSRWKSVLVRWALRHADAVLAVDMSLKESLRQASGWNGETIRYMPTGYDTGFWKPGEHKEEVVLCVAVCDSRQRVLIKGIDLLLEAAERLKHIRFRIIGISPSLLPQLEDTAPPNIELLPPVPRDQLLLHYQRAKVYCQPSRREGLPNTLCEAMLCEALPVGTRVGGIPTAIDECGFLVDAEDIEELCRGIEAAMRSPLSEGAKARERIARLFPKSRREREMIALLSELADA
jgi:glycosyltransferase involved in cell wall biosynthesis